MGDTDVDEDKCFLLFLLPSFRQFNDEQIFLAPMEILKIMRHFKLQQNLGTHSSCSLPFFSNAVSLQTHRILPPTHKIHNQQLLCRIQKFSPDTCPITQSSLKDHQLPQLSSLSNMPVPALSPITHFSCQVKMAVVTFVLSYLLVQQRICKLNFFFHFLYKLCDFNCISVSYSDTWNAVICENKYFLTLVLVPVSLVEALTFLKPHTIYKTANLKVFYWPLDVPTVAFCVDLSLFQAEEHTHMLSLWSPFWTGRKKVARV